MFDDFIKNCAMENKLHISDERIEAQTNSVLARIETDVNMKNKAADEFDRKFGVNAEPQIVYVEKRSLLKTVVPLAAAAAALAVAMPLGINYFGNKNAVMSAGSGASNMYSESADDISGNIIDLDQSGYDPSAAAADMKQYDEQKAKYGRVLPTDYTDIPRDMTYGIMTDIHRLMVSHRKNGSGNIYTDSNGRKTTELDYLSVGDAEIIFENGTAASEADLTPGIAVLVKYDLRNDSYPGEMHCTKIVICLEQKEFHAVDVPSLGDIVKMSESGATDVLKGTAEDKLIAAWGEPDDNLTSGVYAPVWRYNGFHISVHFDANGCVDNVGLKNTLAEKPPMPSTPYVTDENKHILNLLRDFGTFAFSSFQTNYSNYSIIDKERSETVSVDGQERTFYKAKDEWVKTLEYMTTDKARKALLEYQSPYRVYEKDGVIYLDPTNGAGGINMGMSELRLDDYEKVDENTLKLNFTSFGDKEEWETTDDLIDEATITLVKADGKWLIDECPWKAIEWLSNYSGIKFEGEFYPF